MDKKRRNKHVLTGKGVIRKIDGSESVSVFYVLETYDNNIGGKNFDQIWIPWVDVTKMDFEEGKEPAWLQEYSILETDNHRIFKIKHGIGVWNITEEKPDTDL